MKQRVSILIPAYNAEKFIQDTMLSAINQTWSNKEIIVIDDGSSDATLQIAKSLESANVKVVSQNNTGVCGARNKALTLAQGDYIQWLDADDLLHPEKIARQLESVPAERDSLTLLTSAWGKFFHIPEKAKFVPDSLWQDLEPLEWILARFNDNVWMNPTVWLVSRRLTELAGPWDERLTKSGDDDGEYICRVVAASKGVKFVRDALCYYRIGTPGSLNWNMETSKKNLEPLFLSLNLALDHLLGMENSDRTRKACIQHLQTFLPYFIPDQDNLVAKLNHRAEELGGELVPPFSWKYYLFEKTLGSKTTHKLKTNWRIAKLLAQSRWEKMLHLRPSH